MIQDIFPRQFHNEFRPVPPQPADAVLCFQSGQALIGEEKEIRFPTVSDFPGSEFLYLFSVDERPFFLVRGGAEARSDTPPAGFRFVEVRTFFRRGEPRHLAFAGTVGFHLASWYERNTFCGACGARMGHSKKERALVCPNCGQTVYPTISPAVIVGVLHKGKILMTKYAGRSYKNYALVAGFNEIGESIEETVYREVKEEVGLPVKNLRYYKSQPWPFTSSLLMGFFCELDGECEEILLDQEELSEAGWYGPEEVPDDAEHTSLTAEMMAVFKRGGVGSITRRPLEG